MPPQLLELPGLRVTVDRVIHHAKATTPKERPHCFVYFITIHNDTASTVTLHRRKWVVREASGEQTIVEGDGIVGQEPEIEAGSSFTYNSYHLLSSLPATAEGAYLGQTEEGHQVVTRIPPFTMSLPPEA